MAVGKGGESYDFKDFDGDTEPWGNAIYALYFTLRSNKHDSEITIGKKPYKYPDLLSALWNLCTQVKEECDMDGDSDQVKPFLKTNPFDNQEAEPSMPKVPIIALNQIFDFAAKLRNINLSAKPYPKTSIPN